MRWTEKQLALFEKRRSADGKVTTAHVRPTANRKRRPPRVEATEHQVHVALVAHLRTRCRPGVSWWHHPAGELRHPSVARKLKTMGARPGVPDLLLLIDGRLHGLELKRDRGGRLSPDQKAMHTEMAASGAVIAIARGLDEALDILYQWGAFLPADRKDDAA